MTRLTTVALLALWAPHALQAGDDTAGFVFETHTIASENLPEPLRVSFKLDTMTGGVWRYTDAGFVPVPVDPPWYPSESEWPRLNLKERERRKAILQKLHEIILPEISFRQVPLPEALASLVEASRQNDPEGQGVDIVTSFSPVGDRPPPVTFQARHATLFDVLNILCQLADLRLRIRNGAVELFPFFYPEGELIQRLFVVEPEAVERLRKKHPDLFTDDIPPEQTRSRRKAFFESFGVSLSAGSSVEFIPEIARLTVRATHKEIMQFERIVHHLNLPASNSGRFRLAPWTDLSQPLPTVLLLDTDAGDSWIYEIATLDGTGRDILTDGFVLIPQRLRSDIWTHKGPPSGPAHTSEGDDWKIVNGIKPPPNSLLLGQ